MNTRAATIGLAVLAGLAKGRQRAIQQAKARAAHHLAVILPLALADRAKGRPERGRAGRIARQLGGALSERHVKRILDTLSCPSESVDHNGQTRKGDLAHV